MSDFSAREQYFLELVNRARLDPLHEAARLLADPAMQGELAGGSPPDLEFAPGAEGLNRGLDPGTISGLPLQPLAPNGLLRDAAEGHSEWMLEANIFSHTGEGGSSVAERIADAGYVVVAPGGTGENLSWRGTTGDIDMESAVLLHHAGLFASDGHRFGLLTEWFRESGVAQVQGDYTHPNGTTYDSSMLTQKFAASGPGVFLTGVVYDDAAGAGFYAMGAGVEGVLIAAEGASTLSAPAGGYALGLMAAPDVAVTLTWGTVEIGAEVDLSGGNAKLDLVAGTGGVLRLLSSADMVLGAGAVEGALLGAADLALTGNDAGNLLIGNRGANTILGGAGDDTLAGGAGDDTLDGGEGTNTARFSGNRADYLITDGPGPGETIVADQRAADDPLAPHDGTNSLTRIRFLEFADEVVDLTPPPDPGTVFTLSGSVTLRAPGWLETPAMAEGVTVRFTAGDDTVAQVQTGADGAFSFDIAAGTTGTLELLRDYAPGDDKAPAIADVLALFRVVVGASEPAHAADLLASDYTGTGTVSIQDVLALFRHVVGVEGGPAPRFVFVEEGDMPADMALTGLPTGAPLEIGPMAGHMDMGFTAILTGDVHGYT